MNMWKLALVGLTFGSTASFAAPVPGPGAVEQSLKVPFIQLPANSPETVVVIQNLETGEFTVTTEDGQPIDAEVKGESVQKVCGGYGCGPYGPRPGPYGPYGPRPYGPVPVPVPVPAPVPVPVPVPVDPYAYGPVVGPGYKVIEEKFTEGYSRRVYRSPGYGPYYGPGPGVEVDVDVEVDGY